MMKYMATSEVPMILGLSLVKSCVSHVGDFLESKNENKKVPGT
jgi:hypothetical protein